MPNTLKLILVPLVILSSVSAAAAQAKVDRENDRLVGAVHKVRVEIANLFDRGGRRVEGPRFPRTETTYDFGGRMIALVHFNHDGSIQQKTDYTHDGLGNVAEVMYYNQDGALISKTVHGYDAEGRVAEKSEYDPGGLISSKWTVTYGADGSPLRTSLYSYDGEGRISGREDYKADGSIDGRYLYKYDAAGNLKKVVRDKTKYLYCNQLFMEEVVTPVEFDAYGNWTKSIGADSATYRTITFH